MNVKEILENLGYKLKDCGSYWQTNAIYRGGDNPTALQIYKDTGIWKDYVEDTVFLPFEALVKKTLGTNDSTKIKSFLNNVNSVNQEEQTKRKILLNEEKSYPPSCIDRLLPQYELYRQVNEKISDKTLKTFKAGLATSGKMYRRFVFPIVRQDGKIHGFSGRKALQDLDGPKWIHLGKKSNWFYPYYVDPSIKQAIEATNSVHIVESIGDCLSLHEAGVCNVLVSFGVSLSPIFISRLSNLGLKKIYISFNNDFSSEKNAGFEGSIKSIFKLMHTVDFESLFFVPPHENDFGVMQITDIQDYQKRCENFDHKASCETIIEVAEEICKKNNSKSFEADLKKFKKLYRFHYD